LSQARRQPDKPSDQSTPLAASLAARMAAHGPMPVADYMAACLSDPEHGYYRTAQPLGRSGDFITAPEISQVFGELLGLWAASVWQAMSAPDRIALVELGPGRGTLAADALRAAQALPEFRAALQLHLVEMSPVLRAEQAQTLDGEAPEWHETIGTVPDGPAIILANEFLDALPVRQIVWRAGAWRERCVGHDAAQGFYFTEGDVAVLSAGESDLLPETPLEGDIAELRPGAASVVGEIARRSTHGPQAALFVDYGHGEAPRGDTLQAVSGHSYAGVFEAPGAHDLTAHVDFRALARHARAARLEAFGPIAQGRFLLQLGLEARYQSLMRAATPEQRDSITSGVRRLADPTQMGELFKVMAVATGLDDAPPPFGDHE
jgi:NADH dehydrogenase [ubiquinone] 1 alpha subcomplex assembly factor 7